MSKNKTMCGWKKDDIKDDFDDLKKIVKEAKYVCTRCARAADKKKRLCKPKKI